MIVRPPRLSTRQQRTRQQRAVQRRILLIAIALSAVLAVTSCSAGESLTTTSGTTAGTTPIDGGTLVYATDVEPAAGGFDPYVATAFSNQNVLVQTYESLLSRDRDGTIEPALATAWKQVDSTTLDVTLRNGVQFSDGSPLTVDDVVYSFGAMTAPSAPQSILLHGLESTTALDPRTIEFRFTQPNGSFLNILAAQGTTYIVNSTWYRHASTTERQRTTNGTGPFALDAWNDDVSLELVRNPHYWQEGLPHLDALTFEVIPDETARTAALRQGSGVDAAWVRDGRLIDTVVGTNGADNSGPNGFTVGRNSATRELSLFVNARSGPLADVDVRQAISLSLDRATIAKVAGGTSATTSLIVPPGDPNAIAVDPDTPNYRRDVAGAKRLLAASGTPHPKVRLDYASDASFATDVPAYEVMKEELAEAGIELQLAAAPWASIISRYIGGTFTDLIAVPGMYQPDVTSYFASFFSLTSPTNRVTTPQSPGVAELAALTAASDPVARRTLLATLEDIVATNAYVYVLYAQPQRFEVWSHRVKGYRVDPYGYRVNLKNAWLAE
ncbi:ABC transporter substrate-binding protein [soil metagenome]